MASRKRLRGMKYRNKKANRGRKPSRGKRKGEL
jgi:hypothetical protein